jgi:hypothetical protein
MANNRPWDFDEARAACRKASQMQERAENALRESFVDAAHAQESYRQALAEKIVELRADGLPATICQDLAKGNEYVSELRREWDIAEGVKEAMQQAAWRHTADRKDAQRFADWSQRREMAETGHLEPIG